MAVGQEPRRIGQGPDLEPILVIGSFPGYEPTLRAGALPLTSPPPIHNNCCPPTMFVSSSRMGEYAYPTSRTPHSSGSLGKGKSAVWGS